MNKKSISDADAIIIFRVGPVYCCAPTMSVMSVIMPPDFTVPPGASMAEPGIFKSVYGLVHAVDLRKRFGVDDGDIEPVGRIIIAEVENGRDGFWVDEIVDVIQFPMSGWGLVPAYIPVNVFLKTLMINERINLYTDFDCLHNLKTNGVLREHIKALKEKDIKEVVIKNSGMHKNDDLHAEDLPSSISGEKEAESHINKMDIPVAREVDPGRFSERKYSTQDKSYVTNKADIYSASDGITGVSMLLQGNGLSGHKSEMVSRQKQDMKKGIVAQCDMDNITRTRWPAEEIKNRNTVNDDGPVVIEDTGDDVENGKSVFWAAGAVLSILAVTILLLFNLTSFMETNETSKRVEDRSVTKDVVIDDSADKYFAPDKDIDGSDEIQDSEVDHVMSAENGRPHAEIKEDEGGITIVLIEEPDAGESLLTVEVDDVPGVEKNEVVNDSETGKINIDERKVEELDRVVAVIDKNKHTQHEQVNAPRSVIHIVKKGDTLWHIALRYINNPYRYPELARLSKISNPDRIYPGDKVKIIIKSKNK